MGEERLKGKWFDDMPRTEWIYRLIERLRGQEKEESRIRALITLGESSDPRAVKSLIKCSYDENAVVRRYATEGLFRLRSVCGVEALSQRLKDENEDRKTRKRAAEALGEIRSHSAQEVLIVRLEDRGEDPTIRIFAAEALARAGTKRTCQVLQGCLGDENPSVRKAAEEALRTGISKKMGKNGYILPLTTAGK
ncbi:MAG: HEAT repeat domain-containing protein [Methanomicrobiales archaeon]|nr:HEAT repeat domain-containing protein [Methanomicrobiales archaeon]